VEDIEQAMDALRRKMGVGYNSGREVPGLELGDDS